MSGDIACYWEKQGADRLCAVHCVNALLQGPHFTEVELARHAHDLDAQERALLQGPAGESTNVDASGNFSIGVIEAALRTRGYGCYNTQHPAIAASIRENPASEAGFICNSHAREHWFTIRRVAGRWWNLDSTKHAPQGIGEVYLAEFLNATRQEGFTIFVVRDSGASDGTPSGRRATGLPEPTPGAFSGRLQANQFFLTAPRIEELKRQGQDKEKRDSDDAQRIGGGGGGGGDEPSAPSFTVIAPADKRKTETDWKSLGTGQSLGGGGAGAGAGVAEDEELQAALRASALEAARSSGAAAAMAAAVPEEPPAGSPGVTTIQVRLPSGKKLQRRFAVAEHTVAQLVAWVERASVEDASLGLPVLSACEAYSLMKRVIPGGQMKIERAGDCTRIAGEEAGSKALRDAGFEAGGEALTLQL